LSALVLATAAFIITHFVTSTPLRPKLVAAMGEWPYRGVYSVFAFITLGWMIWAYGHTPRDLVLWSGMHDLPVLVMPFALILIACGYFRNPTMVGAEGLLKSEDPARGMIRITRHPIMWGLMLWAAAHMLALGDVRALVFFGGFFLVAAIGSVSMDRRKRANPDWARFAAATSHIPFVAIAQGRNRIDWREIGWKRPLIGLVAFFFLLWIHPWLFGVRPY
jgi:uncharacterized membrane protein